MEAIFTSSDFVTNIITTALGSLLHLLMDGLSMGSLALGRI